MLEKKDFIRIMEKLKELRDDLDNANNALGKLDRDFGGLHLGRVDDLVLDVLRLAMEDNSEWIGYYIYELKWGINYKKGCVTEEGKDIKLKTLEDLYKLLKNNYETRNKKNAI